jgi:Tol biopolymer transport system component
LVVLIAGATFWVVKRRLPYAAGVPDVKFQQLTLNSSDNLVTGGAISPDGKYLAYTDANGMHIKLVESGDIQRVREPDALKSHVVWEIVPAAWFPDSKRFLVNAHPANESNDEWSSQTSSIWLVSVGGGAPLKLRDNAAAWSVSPDGSLISFGTNKGQAQ